LSNQKHHPSCQHCHQSLGTVNRCDIHNINYYFNVHSNDNCPICISLQRRITQHQIDEQQRLINPDLFIENGEYIVDDVDFTPSECVDLRADPQSICRGYSPLTPMGCDDVISFVKIYFRPLNGICNGMRVIVPVLILSDSDYVYDKENISYEFPKNVNPVSIDHLFKIGSKWIINYSQPIKTWNVNGNWNENGKGRFKSNERGWWTANNDEDYYNPNKNPKYFAIDFEPHLEHITTLQLPSVII